MSGWVDLHVNGFRGCGFGDPDLSEARLETCLRALIADGTDVFLPTLITAEAELYARNLPLLARVMAKAEFTPHVPGLHLEGPFLSPADGARGAHRAECMRRPDPAVLDRLMHQAEGRIRMITVAADLPGVEVLIRHAGRLGLTVALGHHLATGDDLARAADAGARVLTHLGNAMPHQVDRHANPMIAGLSEDRLDAMFIGDGHHLPWGLLKVLLRAKGLEHSILVSDAAPVAGLPPGPYRTMDNDAEIRPDGRLVNVRTGYMVGSSSTIRRVVEDCRKHLDLDEQTLYRLAVSNPLRLIGVPVPVAVQTA